MKILYLLSSKYFYPRLFYTLHFTSHATLLQFVYSKMILDVQLTVLFLQLDKHNKKAKYM